ncbi:UNVERIFIED_CONTAM: hypothetical protein Cloal_0994 [Acetivibrio alkalicellulosi]
MFIKILTKLILIVIYMSVGFLVIANVGVYFNTLSNLNTLTYISILFRITMLAIFIFSTLFMIKKLKSNNVSTVKKTYLIMIVSIIILQLVLVNLIEPASL